MNAILISRTEPTAASETAQPNLIFSSNLKERYDEYFATAEPQIVVSKVADLPKSIVDAYAVAAKRHAWAEQMEDGCWFASIAGLDGVWGEGESAETACEDLYGSLISWIAVRRNRHLDIPPIEGHDLNL